MVNSTKRATRKALARTRRLSLLVPILGSQVRRPVCAVGKEKTIFLLVALLPLSVLRALFSTVTCWLLMLAVSTQEKKAEVLKDTWL